MASEKFPEAFDRFERWKGTLSDIDNYSQLRDEFRNWSQDKWIGSNDQNEALKEEAEKRGIKDTFGIEKGMILRRNHFVEVWRNTRTGRFVKR